MSQTYAGIIAMLLSQFLPYLGLEIGSEQLTATVSTLFLIGGALWAARGRYRLGGVNFAGLRV